MSIAALRLPLSFEVADPTADETYLIARVPKGFGKHRLTAASAVLTGAVASSGTDGVSLQLAKVGADGVTVATNITSALGGLNSAWVADTPRDFVVTDASDENVLVAGEYIKLTYDETGVVAPGTVTVFLELAPGV